MIQEGMVNSTTENENQNNWNNSPGYEWYILTFFYYRTVRPKAESIIFIEILQNALFLKEAIH